MPPRCSGGRCEKGPSYGYYRYYRSDEAKKEEIEKVQVFDYVDALDTRLQAANKPDGSSMFPAKSCKDLKKCYPELKDDYYWIDPNDGSSEDAFLAFCSFKNVDAPETCIKPKTTTFERDTWVPQKSSGFKWFLEEIRQEEEELQYEAHSVQMDLLRIDSSKVRQNVTYHCRNSNAHIMIMSDDDNKMMTNGHHTNRLNVISKDGCKLKDNKWHKTVFEVDTTLGSRLPIVDIAVSDVGGEGQEFGIEVGPICFQ
jgi:hypothetical protein